MVDTEIIHEWLGKADEDFEFARINFERIRLLVKDKLGS